MMIFLYFVVRKKIMSCKFRHGFLEANSSSGESISDLANGEFDYALLSLSWDKRCLCVTNADKLKAQHCNLIIPSLRDQSGLMDKHEPLLIDYAKDVGNYKEIHGDTSDVINMWVQLEKNVFNVYKEVGRPLKVFIDLSTCVRYLALGLISKFMNLGVVKEVSVFYAEGKYPDEINPEDQYELFTAGGWDVLTVPGLEGEWDPNKERLYFVSVGFEGSKTLRLISREEPDKVSLLFPDPGVREQYVIRTLERNEALIKRFQISDNCIVRSSAGNAVEGWKRLTNASIEKPEQNNVFYVCCGTKPQSLAFALRAIVLQYPALLYIKPDRHRVLEVDALGVYWRYDIKDMSSIQDG